MRNPVITLANDTHHDTPVMSLNFEMGFLKARVAKSQASLRHIHLLLGHTSSKTTENHTNLTEDSFRKLRPLISTDTY